MWGSLQDGRTKDNCCIIQKLSSLFYSPSNTLYQSTAVNPNVWNKTAVITSTSGAFLEFHRCLHLNLSTQRLDLVFTKEDQWELRAGMAAHVRSTWRERAALAGWTFGWFIFTTFGFRSLSSISLFKCWKFSMEKAFCGGICSYRKTLGKVNIFHSHGVDPVGRDFKYHLIPFHLTWDGTLFTTPVCSKSHPAWHWAHPGMDYLQLL